MTGIYSIKNLINGKRYIGASKNIHNRWIDHRCKLNNHYKGANKDLQTDWDLYGESNFEFSVLEEYSISDLDDRESYWILYYNTTNPLCGYNKTYGGKKPNMSEEFKQNLTGKKLSSNIRKKMSEAHKGKVMSEEHKQKISATLFGKMNGTNNPMYGRQAWNKKK